MPISQPETTHRINELVAQHVLLIPVQVAKIAGKNCSPCCCWMSARPQFWYEKNYLCGCRFSYFSEELPDWDSSIELVMSQVVPAMKKRGYSFGLWSTHEYSSVLYGIAAAAFVESVFPPQYNAASTQRHSLRSVADAICLAALAALEVEMNFDDPSA